MVRGEEEIKMRDYVISVLECSAVMPALALLYMLLTPLLARRYSEKWRYYAWLIIVVGLIIPFRPRMGGAAITVDIPEVAEHPVAGSERSDHPVSAGALPPLGGGGEEDGGEILSHFVTALDRLAGTACEREFTFVTRLEKEPLFPFVTGSWVAGEDFNNSAMTINTTNMPAEITWGQIAAAIWLAGVASVFAYHFLKYIQFVKTMKRWSEDVKDEHMLKVFQGLKADMKISKYVGLRVKLIVRFSD
jgi:beta-lactamase regulating signal transducer with metallopeptidase domain